MLNFGVLVYLVILMLRRPLKNMTNKNDNYHVLNDKDRRNFNMNLKKIKSVQIYFDETFKNKIYRYYYLDEKTIKFMDFKFNIRNYMHLCGFKYGKGPKKFWSDLKINRVNFKELLIRDDETIWQKMEVLDALKMLDTLSVGISDTLGETLNLQYNISVLSAHRRIFQLILLSDDYKTDPYFPVSLRNTKKDVHRLPPIKQVVCIKCITTNSIIKCKDGYEDKILKLGY